MSLVTSFPLSTSFTGINTLQANGNQDTGNNLPAGMPGNLDIINGAMKATMHQTDTPTSNGIRSEIIPFGPSSLGSEQWYTWECLLDQADWADQLGQILIMQMHQLDSLALTASIDFGLVVRGGKLLTWLPLVEPPSLNTNSALNPVADVQFGHWYKFALHAIWKNDSTGFMEVYMDGAPIYKKWNRGTAYNSDTPYMKLGIYDSNHSAAFGTKSAHYRNVNLWSGNDGYTTVMGTTPVLPARLITA